MLPITLDPKAVRVGLAGTGEGHERKRALLVKAGVNPTAVSTGASLRSDLSGLNILFVAGLDAASAAVAQEARAAGILVNVEDQPELCDFHVPALVRRGELLLTVSTGGKSPGLSRALREELERLFGPEWDERLDEIGRLRESWRSQGIGPEAVARRTRDHLAARGWLS
jgi:precorrin-2 dehydrogenase/sirohydrochlorin ferrochelatase